jgi:hypothetical protein
LNATPIGFYVFETLLFLSFFTETKQQQQQKSGEETRAQASSLQERATEKLKEELAAMKLQKVSMDRENDRAIGNREARDRKEEQTITRKRQTITRKRQTISREGQAIGCEEQTIAREG